MTSNIGAQILIEGMNDKGELPQSAIDEVMSIMRSKFRPEFLNRIDEIICFKPLTLENLRKIVRLILRQLEQRLNDQGIKLDVSGRSARPLR